MIGGPQGPRFWSRVIDSDGPGRFPYVPQLGGDGRLCPSAQPSPASPPLCARHTPHGQPIGKWDGIVSWQRLAVGLWVQPCARVPVEGSNQRDSSGQDLAYPAPTGLADTAELNSHAANRLCMRVRWDGGRPTMRALAAVGRRADRGTGGPCAVGEWSSTSVESQRRLPPSLFAMSRGTMGLRP